MIPVRVEVARSIRSAMAKNNKNLKRDTELFFELGSLRCLDRVWKQFMNADVANIAEHLFRVAWIALTISKLEGAGNHEKILKIALAHDASESRTGDVNHISRQYTKRDEESAVKDIFEGTVHETEMIELMTEYEKRESIESKIVKDADNIDVELEFREMQSKGYRPGSVWLKSRQDFVYPKLYTNTARKLWKVIGSAEPNDWHLNSKKNRFKGGDWKRK